MELGNFLPYLVNRAGQQFVARFTPALAEKGIDIQAWRVLGVLIGSEALPVGEIAELTSINLSTLSRVLGRMEKAALIARTQDQSDGRSWSVHLTSEGRSVTEALMPYAIELEIEASRGLTSEEQATLKSLLKKLHVGMQGETIAPEQGESLTVSSRFCGPSDSGHGGYTSGLLASHLSGPVEVTLRRRIPMDKKMTVVVEDEKAALLDGEDEICTALPGVVELDPIPMPSLDAVASSENNFPSEHDHFYPHCFVCGPARKLGDGLRIFSGVYEDGSFAAASWTPDEEFANEEGRIDPVLVWAVLDCPAYFGMNMFDRFVLTGRMAVDIAELPWAGEPYVLAGWRTGQDGRKHYAASALYDTRGTVLAKSTTTWIEPKS